MNSYEQWFWYCKEIETLLPKGKKKSVIFGRVFSFQIILAINKEHLCQWLILRPKFHVHSFDNPVWKVFQLHRKDLSGAFIRQPEKRRLQPWIFFMNTCL